MLSKRVQMIFVFKKNWNDIEFKNSQPMAIVAGQN